MYGILSIFYFSIHVLYVSLNLQPKNTGSENVLVLYLHNNSICEINNLDELCNLTHLYLQWNKIRRIENLSCLRNLTKLYLGNNQINVVENLEDLGNLKELHIDHQVLENGEVLCFDPRCISTLGVNIFSITVSLYSNNNFFFLYFTAPSSSIEYFR